MQAASLSGHYSTLSEDDMYQALDVTQRRVNAGEKHATLARVLTLSIPEIPTLLLGLLSLFVSSGMGILGTSTYLTH